MKICETKNRFKKDAETHSSSLHRGWTFWSWPILTTGSTKMIREGNPASQEGENCFVSTRRLLNSAHRILLVIALSAINRVKSQFQPIRGPYLVKNSKLIITNGMLTQIKLLGNISVGKTF